MGERCAEHIVVGLEVASAVSPTAATQALSCVAMEV
jgi:hypothetical protein